MEALRLQGVDAQMLVCEKLSQSPYVTLAASPWKIKFKFFLERLKILISNGFNRKTLFKIDTGEIGLPLWKHPLIKGADAILLNWVNQGMLSIHGVKKILNLGKSVMWTMHDMWCMTGICHHAGHCDHFLRECGKCHLLSSRCHPNDLSHKIWTRKKALYQGQNITFVAVSNWLKEKSGQSSLLSQQKVIVIPNAFPLSIEEKNGDRDKNEVTKDSIKEKKIRILFGAARLDDPIKGLDTLKETAKILRNEYPEISRNMEIAVFGNVKMQESLNNFDLPLVNLGILTGEEEVEEAYKGAQILVSASSYETLPGTLVEAQAYGSIPVSFNQGGQSDIIHHLDTGYIAEYDNEKNIRARNLAKGIEWAAEVVQDPKRFEEIKLKMRANVEHKFSYEKIAKEYLQQLRKQSI